MERTREVRDGEDAIANTRDARAPQNPRLRESLAAIQRLRQNGQRPWIHAINPISRVVA